MAALAPATAAVVAIAALLATVLPATVLPATGLPTTVLPTTALPTTALPTVARLAVPVTLVALARCSGLAGVGRLRVAFTRRFDTLAVGRRFGARREVVVALALAAATPAPAPPPPPAWFATAGCVTGDIARGIASDIIVSAIARIAREPAAFAPAFTAGLFATGVGAG